MTNITPESLVTYMNKGFSFAIPCKECADKTCPEGRELKNSFDIAHDQATYELCYSAINRVAEKLGCTGGTCFVPRGEDE
jgi:hypothetical protein